jgi:Gram-negative bacterial TonB protein C-terminal/PilZ domain
MSTSAQELPTVTASVERRFYSRIVPHAPIYIAIDGHNDSLLLNVSENGLLVLAPVAVQCNFVARIAIPLSGLPKPVQVNVRVVWTNEVNKQAGIQLLDLSEEDREQIRKWGTREASLCLHRQPGQARVVARPPARSPAMPPVASSLTPSSSKQKIPANKPPVSVPPVSPASTPEVSTSPAARIALWGMAIAAICLAALFFLRNSLLGNSFAHSREILRQSSAAIPAPARGSQVSPQNPDTAKPDTPANAALAAPLGGPASAGREDTFVRFGVGNGANQLDAAPTNSTSSSKQTPPHAHAAATSRPITDSRVEPRISSSATSANSATSDSASENSVTPANSSVGGDTTSEAWPVGNPVSSKDVETRTPTPVPSNPSTTSIPPLPGRNVNSPVIQMDTPARQVMEIHLQRASHASFFDLPGERVLESRSVTMHIQRSVRLPAMHSVWPFNRNKKVVIGGLMSRVDPQLAQAQVSSGDFIRVTAIVNENGRVESVKPIRGRANLVPTVLKAVQEWRYQPTLVDGKPVETKCDVLIQFHGPPRYTARQ